VADSTSADEGALIEEFLRGDRSAIRTVDGWIEAALRDGFQSLREDWEDLKQEVRFRVFRNLSRSYFDGRSSLRTYVHQIVRNVAIDSTRQVRRRRERPGPDGESRPAPGESGLQQWMTRDLLLKVLGRLSAEDRLLVRLVFAEHCSYAEVAHRLGISEGAARTRMSRCKDRLVERGRRLLAQDGGED